MKTIIAYLAFLLTAAGLALGQAADLPRKVVFTSDLGYSAAQIDTLRRAVPSLQLVIPADGQLLKELEDADGVIGGLKKTQLAAAKKLRWMQVDSAGVETYLSPELRDRPITLTNMKIVQGPEIGDHAFALLLSLTRGLDVALATQAK